MCEWRRDTERERDRERQREREREGERENPKQPLRWMEPDAGLDLTNCELKPRVGGLTD